jgi:glycosyltransferase involved in cell wall biosynthesis
MRILQLGKFFPPYIGGIESYLYELIKGLSGRHSFDIVVANDRAKTVLEDFSGQKLIRIASLGTLAATPICPTMPFVVRRLLKQNSYDIVHIHHPNPMTYASLALSDMGKAKLVVTYHSDIIRQKNLFKLYRPIYEKMMKKSSGIIVTSKNYLDSSEQLKYFKNKCHVIPIGIDTNRFRLTNDRIETIEGLKNRYPEPRILFVGRFGKYKGVEYLIRAVANLNLSLILAGSGPLEQALKKLAVDLEIENKVFFVGSPSETDLINYYHACDIFCLPSISRNEAFGIVLIEAMACKKPVISTELSTGTSFVNINGKTGYVVKARDYREIADTLMKLINDRKLRTELGTNALMRVNSEFTLQKMCSSISDLYSEVLGN